MTTYHVGPLSICLSGCTRNSYPNLKRTEDTSGKSDWTVTTWPNWTGIAEETPYPVISSPIVAEVTAQDVTITWKTDEATTSLIEYGLTTSYGMKSAQNTIAERDHVIQLFDLPHGKAFHARAISNDPVTGKALYSADFTFETPVRETRILDATAVMNEPNPAFNRTMFVYYLYQPVKRMTIDILTLSGKTVATLEAPASTLKQGYNRVMWDLRDNMQKRVANGVYAYTMKFYLANNQVTEVSKSNLMIRR
jgi:hypothetical protein